MALKPKIGICMINNCTTIKVSDVTKLYDATDNPGGWNVAGSADPNLERTDFAAGSDSVILSIKFPGQSTYTNFNVQAVVSGTNTPNAYYQDYTFEIAQLDTSDFGVSETKFPDGNYEYMYTLVHAGVTYKTQGSFYSTCQTKCCIDKKLSPMLDSILCGKCGCDELKNYFLMRAYLELSIQSALEERNIAQADILLAKAQKYCDFKKCGC